MPSPPAKPRRRRLVIPPLTVGQQVLFTFEDDFPKDQRKPEAERVLAARRCGKETSVVVPEGLHVQVRDRADLPWHPIEPQRGRGRRPKTPNGTWEDDDLLADVDAIVGSRRDRENDADDDGADILAALCRLACQVLGQTLTPDQEQRLRTLVFGGTTKSGTRTRAEKASVITRELLAWRHNLTDPDVRWMQETLHKALDPADRKKNGRKKDLTGQPIIRPDGRPMLDANGQPATHKPGPRVKMIFR